MFQSAYLKLTALYVVIIMVLSVLFSIALYTNQHNALVRSLEIQSQRFRGVRPQLGAVVPENIAEIQRTIISEADKVLLNQLVFINILILIASTAVSYFLARRTLRPIAQMVEEQIRFTSDASHELRTPLTAMKTEIEVALRDKKLSLKDATTLLKSNLEEIDKLTGLSNHLLQLTKHKRGDMSKREAFEIGLLITEAWDSVKAHADKRSISMTAEAESMQVIGDKIRLRELLVIILDNAIKYNKDGGSITVRSKKHVSMVHISIADTGPGIDGVDLPHIFDRFFRADSSRTKRIVEGHGLGLSIAKQIVEQHRGSLSLESTPGLGTTFIIKLPSQ